MLYVYIYYMRDENEFNGIRHVELISSILVRFVRLALFYYAIIKCFHVLCVWFSFRSFRNG